MITIIVKLRIFSLLVFCVKTIFSDTGCVDWDTYNDEKCLRLFETTQTYDEDVNTCNQYNSTLITITSLEEQHFLENYLFTKHKILENVWTGLRYVNNRYNWKIIPIKHSSIRIKPNQLLVLECTRLCHQNNGYLVDIESPEKQKLVESFLNEINQIHEKAFFWIGGYIDPTDNYKYKWLNSGNEFKYLNWVPEQQSGNNPYVFITGVNNGQWMSAPLGSGYMYNVFCEISFNV